MKSLLEMLKNDTESDDVERNLVNWSRCTCIPATTSATHTWRKTGKYQDILKEQGREIPGEAEGAPQTRPQAGKPDLMM